MGVICWHDVQDNLSKRPGNMWGAVPQHHHAVPPAQPQTHAQAQQFALAQAAGQAQAQAMRRSEVTPPPLNPPSGPGYGLPRYAGYLCTTSQLQLLTIMCYSNDNTHTSDTIGHELCPQIGPPALLTAPVLLSSCDEAVMTTLHLQPRAYRTCSKSS